MDNDKLGEGKYNIYVSHFNHTGEKDNSGKLIKLGFDIELGIQIIAKTDTKINLTATDFDVMSAQLYSLNGDVYKEQSTWDLAAAWADYLQLPIYTTDISRNYYPRPFEPVEIELKAGEEVWLGQYMNGYKTVPYLKAVNMIADLDIEFVSSTFFRKLSIITKKSPSAINVRFAHFFKADFYETSEITT